MRVATTGFALLLLAAPAGAFAYGEPNADGVPSREERLLLTLTNQVRQAPHDWPGWDTALATAEPRRPVGGLPALFDAARYHAADLAATSHFDHTSSDGTPFGQRIRRFFSGSGAAENIYRGPSRDAYSALTGWMTSDGHRRNILDHDWNWLGSGYAVGAAGHNYVQNFGRTSAAAIPAIPAAAAREIPIGKLELVANYHDDGPRPAGSMRAALGTECVTLTARAGPPGNQTYGTTTDLPDGCEPLVFVAEDSDGALTEYPSAGAFMVGSKCGAEYDSAKAALACVPGADGQAPPPVIDAEAGGCRCLGAPGPSLGILALLGLVVLRRRRR